MWRSLWLVLIVSSTATASPDLTVKTVSRRTEPSKSDLSSSRQENLYVQGQNRRQEWIDSLAPELSDFSFGTLRLVIIERCDKGLVYQINPQTREYIRRKTLKPASSGWLEHFWRKPSHDPVSMRVASYAALSSETEDTGETQQILGKTAHRFITRTETTPSAGSGGDERSDIADGWFLPEFRIPRGCPYPSSGTWAEMPSAGDASGNAQKPLGLPVRVKYTSNYLRPGAGQDSEPHTHVLEREVVELSEQPLSPSLFEVPKGYKRVKHFKRGSH